MAAERAGRVGARMRERREELGLTQPQVADRIPVPSVTKDYISRWERGKVETSDAYLELAAAALETTIADLMAGPIGERKPKGPTPEPYLNGNGPSLEERILARLDAIEDLIKAEGVRNATRAAEALQLLEDRLPPSAESQHQRPA